MLYRQSKDSNAARRKTLMKCTSSYVVMTHEGDPAFEYPHYILYLWTESSRDNRKVFTYRCCKHLWTLRDDVTCNHSVDKNKRQICLTSIDKARTVLIFEKSQEDWRVYTREPNEKRGKCLGTLRNQRLSTLLDEIIG